MADVVETLRGRLDLRSRFGALAGESEAGLSFGRTWGSLGGLALLGLLLLGHDGVGQDRKSVV